MIRRIGRLDPKKTVMLLSDVQEGHSKTIKNFNETVETSSKLLTVCKLLNIPCVATEHHPIDKYGERVKVLRNEMEKSCVFGKTSFSMYTKELLQHLENVSPNYKYLLLCGVEAHVCVLSTCLDFLEAGKDVHIVADAVASHSLIDRKYSLIRMKQSGAFLTTSESVMMQLCKDSEHRHFEEIKKLTLQNVYNDTNDI